MSRILNEFNKNVFLMKKRINNNINYESIRTHLKRKRKEPFRKPIWQPMAPSKLFRIRTKEVLTPEEDKQRQHFTNTFDTNMRSITQYFKHEFYLPTLSAGGLTREQVLEEELDQKQLIEDNNRENERIATIRAEREALQRQQLDQQLIVSHLKQTQVIAEKTQQFDELVKKEIQRSKTYITSETLEAAIEEALANPMSYDFAIDTTGNVYFEGSLHPNAFTPNAVPDTSSNTEFKDEQIHIKLKPNHIY